MNDVDAPGSAPSTSAPSASGRGQPRWSRKTVLVFLGACLTGTLLAAYAWRHTPLPASSVTTGSKAAAVTPRLASAAPTNHVVSSALPLGPSVSASANVAPVDRATTDSQLASLTTDYQRLLQHVSDAEQRIEQLASAHTDLQHRLEQSRTAVAPSRSSASKESSAARSTRIQPAAPSTDTPQTEALLSPRVLAVDTWAGQPSVSIIVGTQIRFLAEGDSVSELLVKKADPVNQRVDFVTRAGTIVSSTASALGDAK